MIPREMQQIVQAQYPDGPLKLADFRLETVPTARAGPGQFLIRSIYLGPEPRQRPIINPTTDDNREMRPAGAMCDIGKVIPGSSLGEVVESNHPDYAVGDIVEGFLGWREYVATDGTPHPTNNPAGIIKVDTSLGALPHHLGLFGLPGITPLLALRYEGKPKPGETMVVTTAAGMVGSLACQLGKLAGARVVGLTSRDEKCDYLRNELQLDGVINYRSADPLEDAVRACCPAGVDYFFDNCGGPVSDTIKGFMNPGARYTGSGFIALYNEKGWGQSDKFRGMYMVHDYVEDYPQARRELAELFNSGKLSYRITIFDGIDKAPAALIGMMNGDNIGKYLVQVGPEPAG